eukprot:Protomagalhaensia_wolfi_Nauph_80__493@NODE_1278_length_1614_cov_701_004444_g985_i0_p2_GENE_NODE_1278_length_1614_cov_701_004444_g985_i0NODE_1278_length_1614_cov_701_004444_g985_i0_p2_ORF_typecomplete_len105_score12_51_NODE_1278_length_1614_cov_701_004444_g985_i0570884
MKFITESRFSPPSDFCLPSTLDRAFTWDYITNTEGNDDNDCDEISLDGISRELFGLAIQRVIEDKGFKPSVKFEGGQYLTYIQVSSTSRRIELFGKNKAEIYVH